MTTISYIPDYRIQSTNVLVELTINEYLTFAEYILNNNDYQRKKVIKGKIQEFLKADLLKGCTIPPIVLAVKKSAINEDFHFETFKDNGFVETLYEKKDLLILDGLQRTYVMLEIKKDSLKENAIAEDYEKFFNQIIRAEIYIGLDKLGILYRMLTLNTGQTTMSSRHLMEILFLDFNDNSVDGIKLVSDKENRALINDTTEFNFKEVLDGYNSFIEGTEIPNDRADILENIQTLKELDETDKESFKAFVVIYKKVVDKFIELGENYQYSDEETSSEFLLTGPAFGKNALDFFRKSQPLTGFGAALYFLRKRRKLNFEDLGVDITETSSESSGNEIFQTLNKHFDYIRNKSKKVGNDQRYYFKILFRALLDPASDSYKRFDLAVQEAYKLITEKLDEYEYTK